MTKVSGKSVTVHLRVDSGSFVIKPLPKFLRRKLQLHVDDSKENLDTVNNESDNESVISEGKIPEIQKYMKDFGVDDSPIPDHDSPSFSSPTTTPEKATSENLDTVNNESDNESVISEGKIPEIQKYMKDFGVDDSPIPDHDSPSFSSPTTTPEKATSENLSEYERTINENFKLLNEARPVLRAYNNKLSIAGATILTSSSVEELYPDVSMEGAIIDYATEKILGKKCMEDIENMVKCLGDMPNHKNLDTLKNDSDTESAISKGGIPEIQTYMPEDDPPIPFQNFHSCNSLSTAAEKLNFVGDNTKDALRTDSMKQNDREDSKETTLLLPVLSGDSKVYDFHENSNGTIFEYGDIINNCNTNFTSPLVISLDRSGNSTVCKLSQLDVAKNLFTSPSEVNDESTCINSVSTKTASLKDGSNSSESEEESTNLLSALTAEFNAVTKTMCPNNGTNVLTGTASVGISSALDVSFITVPVNPEEHILSNTPEECAEIDSNHENFQEIDGNDIAGEIQLNYCQSSHTDKRVWDKKAACLFCFQLYSKLSQHLLSKHGSEKEVQAYKNAEVKSYERTRIISKLTKLGNYAHNMRVLKNGKGTIIVCRRPVYLTHFTDYLPCHACYGFYLRSKLWKHYMSCPEKIEQTNPTEKKVQRLGSLLMPCKEKDVTAAITELFSGMLADEVTHVIRSDPLLVKFATKKFNKHIGQPHMKNVIRQNLRVLGNLLIFLKKEEGITSISECLNTKNFFKVRSGVYNYFMSGDKSSPSSAIKSGHFLKKCAKIGVTDAIVSNDRVKRQSLEDFLFLYENDWHDYIDTPCNHILAERKFNKPEDLPLADDIIKFNQIVLQYEKKVLEDNFKNVNYRQLQENTLVHMIVFNRRRPGESERLQVTQFLERSVSSRPQGEVEKILCAAERSTASKLTRIKTFGKKRRGVAILLTEDMCKCIDYIVKNKEKPMKKEDENPYIFGIAGTQSHIRACDVIRKFRLRSGAELPDLLTCTNLRKHMSTLTQLLNLKANELQMVADFLGHNIRVHEEYYRLSEADLQKTQVSKILLALEQGIMGQFKGKTLAEMNPEINSATGPDSHPTEMNQNSDSIASTENELPQSLEIEKPSHELETGEPSHEHEKEKHISDGSVTDSDEDDSDYEPPKKSAKLQKKPQGEKQGRDYLTADERKVIQEHFLPFILLAKAPREKDCQDFIKQFPQFQEKSWRKIKNTVWHMIQCEKKKKTRQKPPHKK